MAESSGVKKLTKLVNVVNTMDTHVKKLASEIASLKFNLEKMMVGSDGLAFWTGEEAHTYFTKAVKNNNANLKDYTNAYNQLEALSDLVGKSYPKGVWRGITAKSGSAVTKENTIAKVHANVTTDSAVINSYAKISKAAIERNYDNLKTYFNQVASDLNSSLNYVTGSRLKNKIKKCKTACTNQGTYCKNRKDNLNEYFKYGTYEARLSELEKKLEGISKSNGSGGIIG